MCRIRNTCPRAASLSPGAKSLPICKEKEPGVYLVGNGHESRCWLCDSAYGGKECKELVRLENLKKYYAVKKGLPGQKKRLTAVDDLSLEVYEGEVLGIVREIRMRKIDGKTHRPASGPSEGKIIFQGKDISTFTERRCGASEKTCRSCFGIPTPR